MQGETLLKTLPEDKGFYFLPLGGSEEFGMNLNVYICDGRLLLVDCGIGFADEHFPGIDLLMPDPALLEKYAGRIEALIITHAHEDHIGAVAYLWERLNCRIFCTAFTASVLDEKFRDAGVRAAPVTIVKPGQTQKAGPFAVEFIGVAHSVPGAVSLCVETSYGRVIHSGDWNLDPAPVTGEKTDEAAFRRAGQAGVLAYIGDSTNAQVPGMAGSESDVEKGLYEVFSTCRGRIAITIFSSNIGRVKSIARAARRAGREIGVVGRSLHRMVGCAMECGYLSPDIDVLSEEEIAALPDERCVMIVTGSQGEPRAALSKISRDEHPAVSLGSRDTVIFSSRAIPGNERNINDVCNALAAAGIHVINPYNTPHTIHVSGHPCRDEIAAMLGWVKPRLLVPVHGERTQLQAHADFAAECQVPQSLIPSNGSLIRLAPGRPEITAQVETGTLALDQKRLIPVTHQSIAARRKLQYTGAVHVSAVLDEKDRLVAPLRLDMVGLIDPDAPGEGQIENRLRDHLTRLIADVTRDHNLNEAQIEEELRIGIRRFVMNVLGIKPKTTVHVVFI